MARRTKLTPDMQARIINALEAGNYFDASCEFAGITERTGHNWMKRGREELERRESPRVKEGTEQWETEEIYVQFFQAVSRASSQVEVLTIAEIKRAGSGVSARYDDDGNLIRAEIQGDWRALTWFMEHRYPKKWGKMVKELTGADGGNIKYELVYPDDSAT